MKCYYAHCMLSYNSTIEEQDLKTLTKLGFDVVNPNTSVISAECEEYTKVNGKENVMIYFEGIVITCDVLAFRPLPDGSIPSGVAAEVRIALKWGIPVIELPCSIETRCMDYPKTKQYLTEIGFYKVV